MSNTHFTTMLYNNRHLVIKTTEGKNPYVIAECYLPGVAARICELLVNEEKNKPTLDDTKKGK
jgi:hypothetical protein